MKKLILILGIMLALVLVIGVLFSGYSFIGRAIENVDIGPDGNFDYVWTTAICDGNECRDFEVTCKDGSVLGLEPVTGFVVFPDDWQDKREVNDSLCDS